MAESDVSSNQSDPQQHRTSRFAFWQSETLRSIVSILFFVLAIKGCVIDQYTVPSSSMHPTLQGNNNFFKDDRILVNKWVFGPRIPFTTIRPWNWGEPDRWDIVVFKNVESNTGHDILVKRVAGLPGERVQLKDDGLYINGELVKPPEADKENINYTTKKTWQDGKRGFLQFVAEDGPVELYNPTSPGVPELKEDIAKLRPQLLGKNIEAMTDEEVNNYCRDVQRTSISLILELLNRELPQPKYGFGDDDEYTVVPEGHYFVLGDNGPVSLDGRFFGWVPHNHLYGPAFAIWWPFGHWRDFSGFSETWWGKLLLYGIPLVLIGLEVHHYIRDRKKRRTSKT